MKPNIRDYYGSIVRVISHNIGFDWLLPFQTTNTTESSGSGFFIDKKGHILTCSHCVEDAIHVFVEIPSEGNKQYPVKIKGLCPYFDLAILQILDYKNKSFCELDDGKTIIEPGLETFALGYPLGQDNMKITKGIISGQQYNFYQTDTPINPGNSGGPLIYKNKVIGVNAAGVPAHEGEGIGYTVPIQRFYTIKKMLFDDEQTLIHYPQHFGFEQLQKTTIDIKKYFKHQCDTGGVYIRDIIPNSPVAKTGLRKGDILCKINNIAIDYYGSLNKKWMNENMSFDNLLSEIGLNKKVSIDYWRGDKRMKDSFVLTSFIPKIRLWYPVFEHIDYECVGGMILMDLNVNLIMILKNLELHPYLTSKKIMDECVVIVNLLVGGKLAESGILYKGDILSKVNDKCVHNLKDFRKQFNLKKNIVKFETDSKKLVVLSKEDLFNDDLNISKNFNYQVSKLFKHLNLTHTKR